MNNNPLPKGSVIHILVEKDGGTKPGNCIQETMKAWKIPGKVLSYKNGTYKIIARLRGVRRTYKLKEQYLIHPSANG